MSSKKSTSIVLFALLLLSPRVASAQNPKFASELWHTTWNGDEKTEGPKEPRPAAPWQPAMWTLGALNASDPPNNVKALARLCRDGGECRKGMPVKMYNYLKYYDRLEIFPDEVVPPGTLIITDFEGAEASVYPAFLCENTLPITKKFVQYPGIPGDEGVNFAWTSQMREVDFYCLARGWAATKRADTDAKKIRDLMGDYVLMELYLFDPKLKGDQDAQFRAWSIILNWTRVNMPDKKIIALVQGGYAHPGTGRISDAERLRVARFTLMFDGVWCFGFRQSAAPVMRDIAALAADPVHLFPGEESWKK